MKEHAPKAILLDLDDTLIDRGSPDACWLAVCEQLSTQIPGIDAHELYASVIDFRNWFWTDASRHRMGRLDQQTARYETARSALLSHNINDQIIATDMAEAYAVMRTTNEKLFPEVIPVLRSLRQRSIMLVLVTNGEGKTQRHKVDSFRLESYFESVLIEGEQGIGKPDERIYLRALNDIQVAPADAWMVGDNLEWDVAMPQQLGLVGIWLDWGCRGVPSVSSVQPDYVIHRFSEIMDLVDRAEK